MESITGRIAIAASFWQPKRPGQSIVCLRMRALQWARREPYATAAEWEAGMEEESATK